MKFLDYLRSLIGNEAEKIDESVDEVENKVAPSWLANMLALQPPENRHNLVQGISAEPIRQLTCSNSERRKYCRNTKHDRIVIR